MKLIQTANDSVFTEEISMYKVKWGCMKNYVQDNSWLPTFQIGKRGNFVRIICPNKCTQLKKEMKADEKARVLASIGLMRFLWSGTDNVKHFYEETHKDLAIQQLQEWRGNHELFNTIWSKNAINRWNDVRKKCRTEVIGPYLSGRTHGFLEKLTQQFGLTDHEANRKGNVVYLPKLSEANSDRRRLVGAAYYSLIGLNVFLMSLLVAGVCFAYHVTLGSSKRHRQHQPIRW